MNITQYKGETKSVKTFSLNALVDNMRDSVNPAAVLATLEQPLQMLVEEQLLLQYLRPVFVSVKV